MLVRDNAAGGLFACASGNGFCSRGPADVASVTDRFAGSWELEQPPAHASNSATLHAAQEDATAGVERCIVEFDCATLLCRIKHTKLVCYCGPMPAHLVSAQHWRRRPMTNSQASILLNTPPPKSRTWVVCVQAIVVLGPMCRPIRRAQQAAAVTRWPCIENPTYVLFAVQVPTDRSAAASLLRRRFGASLISSRLSTNLARSHAARTSDSGDAMDLAKTLYSRPTRGMGDVRSVAALCAGQRTRCHHRHRNGRQLSLILL